MSDVEFDARLASIIGVADADAAAAHQCADELRALADLDPVIVGSFLEVDDGAIGALGIPPNPVSARPAPVVAQRAREGLARRERAIEGDRRTIRSAQAVGPAALDRAVDAGRHAHVARDRLCQARDASTTVAAMIGHRRIPDGTE